MASPKFPPCSQALKPIQHYLKIANEHDTRDPVISYWCRLYALQTGLTLDRKSPDSLALLSELMGWLETQKKTHSGNEAITQEVVGQAHVENYALKIFLWADSEDRAARFNKNVVKAFYTSGMLFDTLTLFGEVSEEMKQNQKYAKWKAAYIHNCLRNGETPVSGPMDSTEENEGFNEEVASAMDTDPTSQSGPSSSEPPSMTINFVRPNPDELVLPTPPRDPSPVPSASNYRAPLTFGYNTLPAAGSEGRSACTPVDSTNDYSHLAPAGGVQLVPADLHKAQKYCKFASSALNYDDVPTAITYLQKCLRFLQTGRDD